MKGTECQILEKYEVVVKAILPSQLLKMSTIHTTNSECIKRTFKVLRSELSSNFAFTTKVCRKAGITVTVTPVG